MSFIDFIGFIIAFIAMGIIYLRRAKADRMHQGHEDEEHEHETDSQEVLRAIHSYEQHNRPSVPYSQRPVAPKKMQQPIPKPHKDLPKEQKGGSFQNSMQSYRNESDKNQNRQTGYEVERLGQEVRASSLIKQLLQSPQDLIILREILGPPKGLQKPLMDTNFWNDEQH